MSRYRVGRIQGRWENLTPPIQGGRFGTGDCTEDGEVSDSSSQSELSFRGGSDSGSPMCRHRRARADAPSSATSVSSSDGDDGMAHLDSVTREKVKLDLETYPALDPATQDAIVAR